MHNLPCRAALAIALALALSACSDRPTVAEPDAKAADVGTTAPAEPVTGTAYERAVRSLIEGAEPGVHFESEATGVNGNTQHASGVAKGRLYSFTVQSRPEADAAYDGTWMSLNGFFQKESGNGFAKTYIAPAALTLVLDALPMLPSAESALGDERAPAENVAGVACQPYAVTLPKQATAADRYSQLDVCVDEANARVVRLAGSTFAGEQFSVIFSEQGEAVELPKAAVFDWSSEFPLAKPGDEVPVKQFENCPDFVKILPEGCEGYISAVPKEADEADKADKSE